MNAARRLVDAAGKDPMGVDAEIAEEFATHLQMIELELIDNGCPPEAAAARARERFGDTGRLGRECRAILLKERIMIRRLHVALTVVLAILLAVSVMMGVTAVRRAREQAVRAMHMEMEARAMAEQARMAQLEAQTKAEGARMEAEKIRSAEPEKPQPE